jgi:two-component system sensor histidine kinase PilS (NtrC family)
MPDGTKDRVFWSISRFLAKRARPEILATPARWRLLKALNIYRLLVAGTSIIVAATPLIAEYLHITAPTTVAITGIIYLALGLVSIGFLSRHWPGLGIQVEFQPLLDLIALTVITQAANSDLGIFSFLLIAPVAVAAANALNLRRALFFSALCALTVLGATLGTGLTKNLAVLLYARAGLFALGLMVVAFIAYQLATRLFETEALAEQRGIEMRELDDINRRIIAQLRTGVVITDYRGEFLRLNPAATRYNEPALRTTITRLAGVEARHGSLVYQHQAAGALLLTVMPLGSGQNARRLVFIEDTEIAREQARAMTLAALGRLTAGIAHQVRNPLSAISQANQLLAEDDTLDNEQQHLSRIIGNQSARLAGMVDSILKLSRRETVEPGLIELATWLDTLVQDYGERHPERIPHLHRAGMSQSIETRFDPGQLEHVVVNLVDNAFIHGNSRAGVYLRIGFSGARAYLDVLDRGPGIAQPERLFEPFATTRANGTGLGLYLARELAIANGAHLEAYPRKNGGSRFRLEFAQDNAWLE